MGLDKVTKRIRHIFDHDIKKHLERVEVQARASAAYARAAATGAARQIDPCRPLTWEFSGFSQHGEDGILDYLCGNIIKNHNRFFFEIGAADGLANCSAWLAYARRFAGVMIEGNPELTKKAQLVLTELNIHNVEAVNSFVSTENIGSIMKMCPYPDLDALIVDIDGIDYYILKNILELGLRPKILVLEYNSSFGPELSVTVPYDKEFTRRKYHDSGLFYGVSLTGLRNLVEPYGYKFVTVDSNGVNAFFIQPEAFQEQFVTGIRPLEFRDNLSDRSGATQLIRDDAGNTTLPSRNWRDQFELIKNSPFVTIPSPDGTY